MPKPHEEMKALHNELQVEGRRRVYAIEARERWLESNPNKTENDYKEFARTDRYKPWRDELMTNLEMSRALSVAEEGFVATAAWVDHQRLDLGDRDLFPADQSRRTYWDLVNSFEDNALADYTPNSVYKFDGVSLAAFRSLLTEAKASAQRNATEFGTELATAMTLAGEEVSRLTTGDRTTWEESDLHGSLEQLKAAVEDWNALLAKDALPDEQALRKGAKECADKLSGCSRAHERLLRSGGGEAPPFVKYQLLATMRAIGEKVGAQYAARAGKASFAGLYDLIRDVPNRGPEAQSAQKARDLVSDYGGDLAKAWAKELTQLQKDLRSADKAIDAQLQAEIDKSAGGALTEKFADWRSNFKNLDSLKNNGEALRKTVAEIAFGLKQRKGIVDSVLGMSDSPKVTTMRERYQQTFDGFVQQLNQEIAQCVKLLR